VQNFSHFKGLGFHTAKGVSSVHVSDSQSQKVNFDKHDWLTTTGSGDDDDPDTRFEALRDLLVLLERLSRLV